MKIKNEKYVVYYVCEEGWEGWEGLRKFYMNV